MVTLTFFGDDTPEDTRSYFEEQINGGDEWMRDDVDAFMNDYNLNRKCRRVYYANTVFVNYSTPSTGSRFVNDDSSFLFQAILWVLFFISLFILLIAFIDYNYYSKRLREYGVVDALR